MENRVVLSGFTPIQIQEAYGLDQIIFNHGTVPGDGRGQTVAIVEALNDPHIVSDANTFSQTYQLPQFNMAGGPTLRVVRPDGAPVATMQSAPQGPDGFAVRTSLDVEWAHAIAPRANILLVEVPVTLLPNGSFDELAMYQAISWAALQPSVSAVSTGLVATLDPAPSYYDSYYFNNSVPVVSAAGGGGELAYPASAPNVLAVGGTALILNTINNNGNLSYSYAGEVFGNYTAGLEDPNGSKPAPDLYFAAQGLNGYGYSFYDSWDTNGLGAPIGWTEGGTGHATGTDISASAVAAIIAIADQGRALNWRTPSPLSTYLALSLLHKSATGMPDYDFHPQPGAGSYGRGSPRADRVIAGLVQQVYTDRYTNAFPAPNPYSSQIGTTLQLQPGVTYTGVIAVIEDYTAPLPVGLNSASIGGSPGELIALGNGQYEVYGSLTINTPGVYPINVQFSGNWVGLSSITTQVSVSFATPNHQFIAGLYQDLLGRAADAGGSNYWASQLPPDTSWMPGPQLPLPGSNLLAVASGFVHSLEFENDLVNDYYHAFLGRAPETQLLSNYWVTQLQAGASQESVMAGILSSQEFLNDSGGTATGFLTRLYQVVLGRNPDQAGLATWLNTLASQGGVQSPTARSQAATGFVMSTEFRTNALRTMFGDVSYRPFLTFVPHLLKRDQLWSISTTSAEMTYWLSHWTNLSSVEAAIASTNEYFSEART